MKNISSLKHLSIFDLVKEGNRNIFDYLPKSRYLFTSSGRGGLEYVCKTLRISSDETILIPSFIAEGIVNPIKKLDINIKHYKLEKDLKVKIEELYNILEKDSSIRMVVIVHFFGYPQPLKEIKKICEKHEVILFEDCAQALFSKDENGDYLGQTGDISLFSLPKSIPLPDGALIFFNKTNLFPDKIKYRKSLRNSLSILAHLIFLIINSFTLFSSNRKFVAIKNKILSLLYWKFYYRLMITMPKPANISNLSLRLLSSFNYDKYISDKITITKILYNKISNSKIDLMYSQYNQNHLLMGLVIFSRNRDTLVSRFSRNTSISTMVFSEKNDLKGRWDYILDRKKYLNESYFVDHHLIIPIDSQELICQKRIKAFKDILNDA